MFRTSCWAYKNSIQTCVPKYLLAIIKTGAIKYGDPLFIGSSWSLAHSHEFIFIMR
jgi:hypothetical protein